jgi:hypothetical protein
MALIMVFWPFWPLDHVVKVKESTSEVEIPKGWIPFASNDSTVMKMRYGEPTV